MDQTITNSNYATLARRFQWFAEAECRESSPLYEHLALAIATDDDMLALAAHAAQGQPLPNLFFAAVHFLLLQDQDTLLGQFYPSLTSALELTAWQNGQPYQRLLAYCDPHGRWLEWLDNGKSKAW